MENNCILIRPIEDGRKYKNKLLFFSATTTLNVHKI